MKKWFILLVALSFGVLGQDTPARRVTLRITDHFVDISVQTPNGAVVTTRKTVETIRLEISADEMKYNTYTGEIEPRGNVRVKFD